MVASHVHQTDKIKQLMFKTKTEYLVKNQREHKLNPPPEDQRRRKRKGRNRGTSLDTKFLFRNSKTHCLDKSMDQNVQGNAYHKETLRGNNKKTKASKTKGRK